MQERPPIRDGPSGRRAGSLRISVGSLIIGDTRLPLVDAALLAIDGRIVAVGADQEVPTPEGVPRIHLPGGTALPGLIDAHVHLTFSSGADVVGDLAQASDADLVQTGVRHAALMLRAGVTTACDLGARASTAFSLRETLAAGDDVMPRLIVAGRPITPPLGHCHFLQGEAAGAAEVRATVARLVEEGSDVVKIIASGGMLGPTTNPGRRCYSRVELRAAVSEAHALGRRITAHAHAIESIADAVDVGVDSIEHGTMLNPRGVWAFDDRLARRISNAGIYVVPGVLDGLANAGRLREAGVTLIAGTDVGVDGTDFRDETLWEVAALVVLGYSPLEAIQIATSTAARHLGIEDTTGSLEVGKDADVLVVDGRPDQHITALWNPVLVARSGRAIGLRPIPITSGRGDLVFDGGDVRKAVAGFADL